VVNAFAIASASQRVCALAIGLEDYTADIGAVVWAYEELAFGDRKAVKWCRRWAGSLAAAFFLNRNFFVAVIVYFVLQLAYSLKLKQVLVPLCFLLVCH
jgi:hypothetical protein